MGFGALALAGLMPEILGPAGAQAAGGSLSPLMPKQPHFPGKARRVVSIFAQGGPTHVDTWDPKPLLAQNEGKPVGEGSGVAWGSPFKFPKCGQSGIEVSEVFPNIGKCIDDICVVRSMYIDAPVHEFCTVMFNTGSGRLVKPSVGSWVTYGLGSENQNLPGFIVLAPGTPLAGAQNWRSAFLPGAYQGTHINTRYTSIEKLIENIRNGYTTRKEQREQLDLLAKVNSLHSQQLQKDAQLEARIQSFELAYQMQMEASDAFDINKEPEAVRAAYAADTEQGRQLLIARRLLEKGVRFVQVWHNGWDHHQNLERLLRTKGQECDKPIAAFLTDLKQRGLLKDTLVYWGGEFGRTPTRQLPNSTSKFEVPGRDHHNRGFSYWLAGGGVKGGTVYGETDEFGQNAVVNKVHVHDLHATILHLLGFDHERLTYRYNGREFRLTDVYGNVVKGICA
ncbi:MAG: DUF1501 domain-containing protein [Verrucomicrobia bacterium]|nr:DUF1501 domain-containing protein [Verrucomicrobiota bacterium]